MRKTIEMAPDFSSRPRRKIEGDVVHRRDFPTTNSAGKTSQIHGFSLDDSFVALKEKRAYAGGTT